MKIEPDYIQELVKLVTDNDLTELSLEEGDKAIIIKKEKGTVTHAVTAPQQPVQQAAAPPVQYKEELPAVQKESLPAAVPSKGKNITSPMVGTFYRASAPGSDPFTDIGKTVSVGQVICIIEAMKLMNEIESEVSGKVVEILVKDGEPVEYGQVLMVIE